MRELRELWRGALPVEIAFWRYAILYGLAINVAATALALGLVLLDVPIAFAVIAHLLPVPYAVVAMTGIWRSADRDVANARFASFAKVGAVAWFGFWLVV